MRTIVPICIIAILTVGIGTYFVVDRIPYEGEPTEETWTADSSFDVTKDYAKTIDMGEKDELVILNLADIQLEDTNFIWNIMTFGMLDKLIKETKPDLITMTGDQVCGGHVKIILKLICKFIDSYGIPWAPVLGNHDGQHNVTRNGNGDIYLSGKYKNVVFLKNDPSLGVGNYIINITKNGSSVHTLFMMDSHDSASFEGGVSGYDCIWQSQIDWYEKAVKDIQKANGRIVPSSCFFHIPLVEYADAYAGYLSGDYRGNNVNREPVACSPHNSGLFDKIQELGSTKLVFVGHDHINCSWVDYNGVVLAYGLKSGYSSYFDRDLLGGTTITVKKDGTTSLDYYRFMEGAIHHEDSIE